MELKVKKKKKTVRTKRSLKEELHGLILDNTNLCNCQDLASANNSLFHYLILFCLSFTNMKKTTLYLLFIFGHG